MIEYHILPLDGRPEQIPPLALAWIHIEMHFHSQSLPAHGLPNPTELHSDLALHEIYSTGQPWPSADPRHAATKRTVIKTFLIALRPLQWVVGDIVLQLMLTDVCTGGPQ